MEDYGIFTWMNLRLLISFKDIESYGCLWLDAATVTSRKGSKLYQLGLPIPVLLSSNLLECERHRFMVFLRLWIKKQTPPSRWRTPWEVISKKQVFCPQTSYFWNLIKKITELWISFGTAIFVIGWWSASDSITPCKDDLPGPWLP